MAGASRVGWKRLSRRDGDVSLPRPAPGSFTTHHHSEIARISTCARAVPTWRCGLRTPTSSRPTVALWFQSCAGCRTSKPGITTTGFGHGAEGRHRRLGIERHSPARKVRLWDGKDDKGNLVKAGKYTVCIEAAREHGTYQIIRKRWISRASRLTSSPGGTELSAVSLEYHKP